MDYSTFVNQTKANNTTQNNMCDDSYLVWILGRPAEPVRLGLLKSLWSLNFFECPGPRLALENGHQMSKIHHCLLQIPARISLICSQERDDTQYFTFGNTLNVTYS